MFFNLVHVAFRFLFVFGLKVLVARSFSFSSINWGIFIAKSYFLALPWKKSATFFFNLSTVHAQNFFSIFSSYFWLTFSLATVSPLGQVVQLQVWHCALILAFSKHIVVYFLLYLCHPANSLHSHNFPQLIHLPLPSASVSLNLAFSCAICIANSRGLIFGVLLYSLFGLPANSLISFSIFLWYSASFLLIYALFFLSFFLPFVSPL